MADVLVAAASLLTAINCTLGILLLAQYSRQLMEEEDEEEPETAPPPPEAGCTEADKRRLAKEAKEMENFWAYTGQKQPEIDDNALTIDQ